MGPVRPLLLAGIACLLGVSLASASSLGSFGDEAFGAMADDVVPCTVADVTLLDGLLDLVDGPIVGTSQLRSVELAGLAGDCAGVVPVVVVQGVDLLDPAAGPRVLLVLDEFAALTGTGDVTLTPTPVPLGDGVVPLVDLTEVRVAFCPGGAACT